MGAFAAGMSIGLAPQTNSYLNLHRLLARYGPRSHRADGEVSISQDGAYFFGDYFNLEPSTDFWVIALVFEAGDPAALVFETKIRRSRTGVARERIYVPVAAGSRAEAAALAKRFRVPR